MKTTNECGFTLIELGVVVLIIGIVIGYTVPAFVQYGRTQSLHGAAENMASEFRLARQRALASGIKQHVHLGANAGYDYMVHPLSTVDRSYFSLPKDVKYAPPSYNTTFLMDPDGRSESSLAVKLANARNDTATVSVQLSGLVTVY